MKDKKMLTLAFLIIVKETAKKIKKFIEASSIKSIESAIKDTDLMLIATINSTKKKIKFKEATKKPLV